MAKLVWIPIAWQFRKAREVAHLDRAKLASDEAVQVSERTIEDIESESAVRKRVAAGRGFTHKTLSAIASKLGLDVKEVIFHHDVSKPIPTCLSEPGEAPVKESGIVFPQNRHVRVCNRGKYFYLSWVGCGSNDSIRGISVINPSADNSIKVIPVATVQGEPVLEFEFGHKNRLGDSEEDWWSAVVAFEEGSRPGKWVPLDLTPFQSVVIEARAFVDKRRKGVPLKTTIPLRVRFEEDDTTGTAGSFHHSSSWNRRPLLITENFLSFRLALTEDFNWADASMGGWWWNVRDVDRTKIFQVTFGQDADVGKCRGSVQIRSINLLR